MDFFQRLGNFIGGKGWINDEEKRRKEQQQSAPQPAPRVQQLPPALANRQGLTQQSPATMAIRQRIAQDNDVRRQNLVQRANDELNKSIKDSNGYYKEDADKLRQELNKGNSLDQSRVQGLLQSVQNRRKEIMEGRVPTNRTNQVIQPRPQIPAVTNTNKQLQSMDIDPNPTMSIIRQAEQQKAERLTQQKATQDYLDSRMRAKGKSEEEIAKSRQERIRLDNEAYIAGQQARRSANLANTVGMVTAPVRAPISFTKGAIDGSGRMAGDMGDAISLVMADTAQGITGDEKWQRVRENILKNQQQRHKQYDEQFGAFKANDSDIKFAHELGQAGARLVADTGMAVVTGGTIPAAIHGAEYASNYVTEANAHGKKTKDVLLPAYAGAGVNAAIEKVGINKLLSPGGKTALGNMVRGAISEGAEEGLQQVSENAFAKVYDKDRNLLEGVPKAVAMGGTLGGPMGGVNAGGIRRPTSPATTNAIEATVPTASPALKQSVANNVENIQNNDIQAVAKQHGNMGKLESYLVNQTTEEVLNGSVRYKVADDDWGQYVDIDRNAGNQQQFNGLNRANLSEQARNVLNNTRIDNPLRLGNEGREVYLSSKGNKKYVSPYTNPLNNEQFESKMRLSPEIRDSLDIAEYSHSSPDEGSHGVAPDGFDYYNSRFQDGNNRFINQYTIAKNKAQNRDTMYGAKTIPVNENWQEESPIASSDFMSNLNSPNPHDETSTSSVAQLGDNVNPTDSPGMRYKMSDDQRKVIDYRLSQDYVAPAETVDPLMADILKSDIQNLKKRVAQYRLEGKKITAEMEEEILARKIDDLKKLELSSEGTPTPAYRGEEIDLENYRALNEYPTTDYDFETDRDIELAAQNVVSDLRSALKNAELDDDIEVVYDKSKSSEAQYITIYNNSTEDSVKIRIANHYKPFSSGSGDLDITLSDPEIKTFADITDRIHNEFKRFVDMTTNPDIKYSFGQQKNKFRQSNNLLSRHLQLTGDESLVFNEWRNEMERKALGYYDPTTDTININKLTEDTLNHELGHKLLRRAENNQELIAEIRNTIGDDTLIERYGKDYGTDNLNILAEEYLADGFSDYSKGILNGEDKVRLATRLNIPPRIIAVYDRIIEAVRSLVGKQDIIRQFYAQAESGSFRNVPQVQDGDVRVREMSLDSSESEKALKSFESVRRGRQVKSIVGQLSEDGAKKVSAALRSSDFNKKARLIVDKSAVNHMQNSGHLTGLGKNGADVNPLTESDIRALPHVFADPDVVYASGRGRNGARLVFERQLENNHRIVAELEYSGKDFNLVTYYNINKDLPSGKSTMSYSPEGAVAADNSGRQPLRPRRSSSDPDNGFDDSIANQDQNVNPRYMLGGENATGFRTAASDGRDFVGIDGKKRFEFNYTNVQIVKSD